MKIIVHSFICRQFNNIDKTINDDEYRFHFYYT